MLAAVTATRYVLPLREGGSLPGLVEADDLGTYVVKWRAAGQGVPVLAAEVICGELARALALPVPALVTVDVAPELAVGEPDQEVQELLRHSAGTNLGMDYLPGALDFSAHGPDVPAELAGRVLWFDALVGNVDRSWRNPNMLFWHGRLQLIDHGAALTFHHHWPGAPAAVDRVYDASQHALVESHPDVRAADAALGPLVTRPLLERVLALVPDAWLRGPGRTGEDTEAPDVTRERYTAQLLARLAARPAWLPALVQAAADGSRGRAPEPRGQNRPGWLGPPPPPGVRQR
ncbi:HipA family kinase [Klenkia terrae]|uniref:HipA family kinase n=1 Tax=Klenkia terrae TaxID=1052259 RepID=A0ABU8E1F0_9ACTN|nr:HipA family kinase [Klenkia terrae]